MKGMDDSRRKPKQPAPWPFSTHACGLTFVVPSMIEANATQPMGFRSTPEKVIE